MIEQIILHEIMSWGRCTSAKRAFTELVQLLSRDGFCVSGPKFGVVRLLTSVFWSFSSHSCLRSSTEQKEPLESLQTSNSKDAYVCSGSLKMEEIVCCLAMTVISHAKHFFSRGLYSIHLCVVWVHFLLLMTPDDFLVGCVRRHAIENKVQGFAKNGHFWNPNPKGIK